MENSNRFSRLKSEDEGGTEARNFNVPSERARENQNDHDDRPRGVFENGRYRRIPENYRIEAESQPNPVRGGRGAYHAGRGSHPRPVNVFGESTNAAKASFPKVVPLNVAINMQKEQQRMHNLSIGDTIGYLRDIPDYDDHFSLKGIFLWPSEESGIEPMRTDDGRLDEIRRRYSCHIVLAYNPRRLCIYSPDVADDDNDEARASAALEAVRNLLQEIVQRSSQCVRFIIAHPPLNYSSQPVVRMVPPLSDGIASKHAVGVPQREGKTARAEWSRATYDDDWHALAKQQVVKNTLTLEMALTKGLGRLVISPGRLEIKAILGSFVFRRMAISADGREGVTPMRDFMANLRSTKCNGGLFRLSPEANLFERLLRRDDILAGYTAGKQCPLAAVKPTYAGIFTFPPHGGDVVDRQLSIEAGPVGRESAAPNIRRRAWTSPVERASSRRLEAFVAALDGGLSWKLEAVAHPYCRNISDELQRFEAKVMLLQPTGASATPGSTELMFHFPSDALYKLKRFYQRTQWKFYIKSNDNYVVHIARLDRFDGLSGGSVGYERTDEMIRRPTQTQWEASVFDERWEEILGKNAALSIGQSAEWDPSIAKFFPSRSAETHGPSVGFADFVNCVNALCQGISAVKPW